MERIHLKYRTYGKALPPRPIRLELPGWAGNQSKMDDGSVPQPWHCNPFVEGSTYGVELIYPYDTECHVINDNGEVRIQWDFACERDPAISGGEFVRFAPKHYGFNTFLDVQAPSDHVLRLEPHPRYFTDETGTVPIPIIGNLQTEWWPKLFFVAFKGPLPGQRHVFRKGEPYAQIIVVPRRATYQITPMTSEEAAEREELENTLVGAQSYIAEHRWHDHTGQTFNDKYKVLSRIFHTEGAEGVKRAIREAMQIMSAGLPTNVSAERAIATAREFHQAGRFAESRAMCYEILERNPRHSGAMHLLAASAMHAKLPMLAVECLTKAVEVEPQSGRYHNDLGIAWIAAGRPDEALPAFQRAAQLVPDQGDVVANLAEALAQSGQLDQALATIGRAIAIAPRHPIVCYRAGAIHERLGRIDDARRYYVQAVEIQPGFAEARARLAAIDGPGA